MAARRALDCRALTAPGITATMAVLPGLFLSDHQAAVRPTTSAVVAYQVFGDDHVGGLALAEQADVETCTLIWPNAPHPIRITGQTVAYPSMSAGV